MALSERTSPTIAGDTTGGSPTYESLGYIPRLSLFTVLEDKQRTLSSPFLVNSLVYISKITPNIIDKNQIGVYYENKFKHYKQKNRKEEITGLLLVYPNYILHMVEASAEMLYKIMQDTIAISSPKNEKSILLGPKVLNIAHNLQNRITQNWGYRVLNITSGGDGFNPGKDSISAITIECLSLFTNLTHTLATNPKLNVKHAVENLHEVAPDLIIAPGMLAHLQRQEEILTFEKFLSLFNVYHGYVQDTELVWPLHENYLASIK